MHYASGTISWVALALENNLVCDEFICDNRQTNKHTLAKKHGLHIKEIPLFSFVMTDSFLMTDFVMTDSFVTTENIKEIPLFSFVMISFVMTDKQTNRIVFQYGVELIATLPSGKNTAFDKSFSQMKQIPLMYFYRFTI